MTDDTALALEIEEVAVDLIDANTYNPNRQSPVVQRATRESLEQYGFVEPVLLRPHPHEAGRFEIVNGEHRWREAQALGIPTVPAVVRDLSDADAKKLTIVLNETQGDADVVLLAALLADLQTQFDADTFPLALPYSTGELEQLLNLAREDWDNFSRDGIPADPGGPVPEGHEVVLTLTDGEHDEFWDHVGKLKAGQEQASVSAVVLDALRAQALASS